MKDSARVCGLLSAGMAGCILMGCSLRESRAKEPAATTADEPVDVPARVDLGNGCSVETPYEEPWRWSREAMVRATDGLRPPFALRGWGHAPTDESSAPFRGVLDSDHTLVMWTEGSIEQGYALRAVIVDGDGAWTTRPVTVSRSVAGELVVADERDGSWRIWFAEDTNDRLHMATTTVRCRPSA